MSQTVAPSDCYPNKIGRILYHAMEEVLGKDDIRAVLTLASLSGYIDSYPPDDLELRFPFSHLGKLQAALEGRYGSLGGRGASLRIGKACFKYGLREFGAEMGVTGMAFRTLPLDERLSAGLTSLADALNRFGTPRVRLEQNDAQFIWNTQRCPVCWERKADQPVCHLSVGVLQEALSWMSGGKHYKVVESQCVAAGDPSCMIVMNKQPEE